MWQRVRDSNPCAAMQPSDFQSAPLDPSGNSLLMVPRSWDSNPDLFLDMEF